MKIIDKTDKLTKHHSAKYSKRSLNDIDYIAIHHSATVEGSAEAFARYHVKTLGWPGIGYHYVVNKDGSVDLCNDHSTISYHVGNSNRSAIGICLLGDFTKEKPSTEQYRSAIELTQKLLKEFNLNESKVLGHNQFSGYSSKLCPSIDMNKFRNDLKGDDDLLKRGDRSSEVKELQQDLNKLGHNAGVEDGIFGSGTENAVKSFQRATNITVDGVAGPQTLAKIKVALQTIKKRAPKKESIIINLGGKKYKIEEV